MAEQGRWFKLWCSALTDPNLSELNIDDFGRWCKLGAYIKEHGENGEIVLIYPARNFCFLMQIPLFHDIQTTLHQLPNITVSITVSDETKEPVSCSIKMKNWFKYQGDYSTNRVKRFRKKLLFQNGQNVTAKKRREETRREDNPIVPLKRDNGFDIFWKEYPKKIGKGAAEKIWDKIKPDILLQEKIINKIIEAKLSEQWQKEHGQFIPHPSTWLNQNRWEDNYSQIDLQKTKTSNWGKKVE